MGSVKDLHIIKEPSPDELGIGRFVFSDRYSVFDWGEMPDHIPHKGEAIALLGAHFFEELEESGISTHYVGLIEEGMVKKLSDIRKPVNQMGVKLLRVIGPDHSDGYDYSAYLDNRRGALIPLEVIYRNSLPEGSSVFKRLKNGDIALHDIGMDKFPTPGQTLEGSIFDFSTKLEASDRYLGMEETKKISGLDDEDFQKVRDITAEVNRLITKNFQKIGLKNEDGKLEFGLDPDGHLILVDVVGTLDECRFTYQGQPVSKEIARIYYRKTPWYSAVEKAKSRGPGWRDHCPNPPPLPDGLREAISWIYCSCTNEITGRDWFAVPPLKRVLETVWEDVL